jgi:hypothetical protein
MIIVTRPRLEFRALKKPSTRIGLFYQSFYHVIISSLINIKLFYTVIVPGLRELWDFLDSLQSDTILAFWKCFHYFQVFSPIRAHTCSSHLCVLFYMDLLTSNALLFISAIQMMVSLLLRYWCAHWSFPLFLNSYDMNFEYHLSYHRSVDYLSQLSHLIFVNNCLLVVLRAEFWALCLLGSKHIEPCP